MQPMVNIALRAVHTAGKQMLRSSEHFGLIKKNDSQYQEFIQGLAQQAEMTIVHGILQAYPEHGISGLYTGAHNEKGSEDICWHINGLDKPEYLANGIPMFSLNIAIEQEGRTEHGLIYIPKINEEFTASRGQGVQLNERRSRVSKVKQLDSSLIGQSNSHAQQLPQKLQQAGADLYSTGSALLDLAYTAAGRLDGSFHKGFSPAETKLAALFIQEAGGLVSDYSGSNKYVDSGELVAGNAKMLKALLQVINK